MKKKIQLIGILSLLLLVLAVSTKSTFDGFYSFYYEDENYKKPMAFEAAEAIVKLPFVHQFMSYTGFDTGYGFFAPNVASDFLFIFTIQDSLGHTMQQTIMPNFEQKESRQRYTTVFNMFLEKVKKQDNQDKNQYSQYLDIILRQIALHVKHDHPKAAVVDAKLYLYDYPSLAKYQQGEKKENAYLVTEFKL